MERVNKDLHGAQGTGLPASASTSFVDATPTGEVQMRVRRDDTRTRTDDFNLRDFRPSLSDTRYLLDHRFAERFGGVASTSEDKHKSTFVESAKFSADNQRFSHGRGDTANLTRPGFTPGHSCHVTALWIL